MLRLSYEEVFAAVGRDLGGDICPSGGNDLALTVDVFSEHVFVRYLLEGA